MNNITIVVAEASYLIQKGLDAVLKKLGDNQVIQKMDKADGLFDSLNVLKPNILMQQQLEQEELQDNSQILIVLH